MVYWCCAAQLGVVAQSSSSLLSLAASLCWYHSNTHVACASLLGRWRHEIQIAILRRRAAMYRAVLPKASEYEHWLLSGNSDRSAAWKREDALEEDAPSEEELRGLMGAA